MTEFLTQMVLEEVDLKQIGIPGASKESILEDLKRIYC